MWFRELTVVLFRALVPAGLAAFALWMMILKRKSGRAELQPNNIHVALFFALTALVVLIAIAISASNWPRQQVREELKPLPKPEPKRGRGRHTMTASEEFGGL